MNKTLRKKVKYEHQYTVVKAIFMYLSQTLKMRFLQNVHYFKKTSLRSWAQ